MKLAFANTTTTPIPTRCECSVRPTGERLDPTLGAGVVQVVPPPVGWASLDVSLEGANFRPSRFLVVPGDVDVAGNVRVIVSARASVTLRVTDQSGTAVPGLRLRLRSLRIGASQREPTADPQATTDNAGIAILDSIAAGTYEPIPEDADLRVIAPPTFTIAGHGEDIAIVVANAKEWDVRGLVIGHVDRSPIVGATIQIDGKVAATTDSGGRFTVPARWRRAPLQDNLRFAVAPPEGSNYSRASRCGPWAWGEQQGIVELLPRRHFVSVVDTKGAPMDVTCQFKKPASGLARKATEWEPLPRIAAGTFECPWDDDWETLVWLAVAPPPSSSPSISEVTRLPRAVSAGGVVHRWVIPAPREVVVRVVEYGGRPIEGAIARVIFQAGAGNPLTAKLANDYDPTTANPFVSNQALPLAEATTGTDGRCTLTVGGGNGMWLRLEHPHHVDRVVPMNDRDIYEVTVEPAGSIRGVVRGPVSGSLVLASASGSTAYYPAVRLAGERISIDKVPVGPCLLRVRAAGDGNQPYTTLAQFTIEPGRTTEIEVEGTPIRLHTVTLRSGGLAVGDVIQLVDPHAGFPVAREVVRGAGEVQLRVTAERYRVMRERHNPAHGGTAERTWANERIGVHSDAREFALTFPDRRARWRLLKGGQPAAKTWLRVTGLDSTVVTDRDGWVTLLASAEPARLVGLTHSGTGFRTTDDSWLLAPDTAGADVEATR